MIQKNTLWKCKYCNTIEAIPNNEFGIKTKDIINVYCPKCFCSGHSRKMIKVENG